MIYLYGKMFLAYSGEKIKYDDYTHNHNPVTNNLFRCTCNIFVFYDKDNSRMDTAWLWGVLRDSNFYIIRIQSVWFYLLKHNIWRAGKILFWIFAVAAVGRSFKDRISGSSWMQLWNMFEYFFPYFDDWMRHSFSLQNSLVQLVNNGYCNNSFISYNSIYFGKK